MLTALLLWVAVALIVAAFFVGRAYQAAKVESVTVGVDPWLAHFREYRATYREESLATVYERWRGLCGFHAAVADYVESMGVAGAYR